MGFPTSEIFMKQNNNLSKPFSNIAAQLEAEMNELEIKEQDLKAKFSEIQAQQEQIQNVKQEIKAEQARVQAQRAQLQHRLQEMRNEI
jgi:uncharacterized protein YaiL (DUF2058 family)